MEIWDGYFADGTPVGIDLVRGEKIPDGIYHLVSEILVRHTDGDYLLMRRDPKKEAYGGYWEATAGGSALKGEDALTCAERELAEETGLYGKLEFIGKLVTHDTIYCDYLCITDCDRSAVRLQEGETVEYKWISEAEFSDFANSDKMIDRQKVRFAPWLEKMGYIKSSP